MNFLTPAFVRVNNPEKRKELLKWMFDLSLLNMTVLNGGYMCIPDGLVLVIRLSAGGRFTKMSKMLCAF